MLERSDLVRISSAPLEDLVEHLGARHLVGSRVRVRARARVRVRCRGRVWLGLAG